MTRADRRYFEKLEAFREEGLALRQADGGTLSPEHRAQLQVRLDRLNAERCHDVTKRDPWAIDASCIRDRAD